MKPGAGQLSLLASLPPQAPEPAAATARALADQAARDQIAHDLDATLFVEAGAGAGKTTQLSTRVVRLVCSGVPITAIAAITFTEKAAAELRQRIRDDLAAQEADALEPSAAARCHEALDELDHAAVGTLHAFAARVLREHPIEAALPPSFGVLDEVGSDLAFEQRWLSWFEALLAQPDGVRLVHFVDAEGMKIDGLRLIARAFADNWDLVRDRVDLAVDAPRPLEVTGLLSRIGDFLATAEVPVGDTTERWLADLHQWHQGASAAFDEFDTYRWLQQRIRGSLSNKGKKETWKKSPLGEAALEVFRTAVDEIETERERLAAGHRSRWTRHIGTVVGRFTLDSVAERRAAGELEFHDLLVLARDLVSHHDDVRRQLHHRYQRLLLDEFQDTDPIQLELAARIAAPPGPLPEDWRAVPPEPGRLFVVGDPKQSIYRFRRADIAQYLRARDQLEAREVLLTTNFRSTPQVLDWVNATFGTLITAEVDSQPAFHPLVAHRAAEHGSVVVLGEHEHGDEPRADELRRREAADVVTAIRTALQEQWPVREGDGLRPCVLGDITILLPARTTLPILEAALTAAGIPYQAENSSLVYATDEIRTLLLALRAVDDPTDELAVVATLRSPLYGCSDRDLFAWRQRGGSWWLTSPLPEPIIDDPVHTAMQSLRELVRLRHLLTPSALLQQLVEERRVLELAVAAPGTRDVFRRVRFVVDQARAWSDAGGAGLRSYLEWTRRQGDDGRYVAEVVLPETDLDAVRIMTVHAAKGLEFPITIVAGLTTQVSSQRRTTVVWPPGTWDLAKGEQHEAFKPVDEQMGFHERLRLLYVACTRAVDHLVVSLHRVPLSPRSSPTRAPSARLLADASNGVPARVLAPIAGLLDPTAPISVELPWADPEHWAMARAVALAEASRPRTRSATSIAVALDQHRHDRLADEFDQTDDELPPPLDGDVDVVEALEAPDPGLLKEPVDLELPPWQRGRYGTAVGRAVHGVLQAVDLATGANLDALAKAQAAAEGVTGRAEIVAALARSALAAPIVRTAAAGRSWRELYVAAPIGELLIEGYLDLLVRTDAGLVIVDYKTDHVTTAAARAAKVARYGPQLAVYGVAVEAVLGEPVAGAYLVFCAPDGAIEVSVPDWSAGLAAMRSQLRHDAGDTSAGADEPTTPTRA